MVHPINSTAASLQFRGVGDGNPFEDIPPILMFSMPATGATAVATNAPIVFTFSTAMAPAQKITWSANVVASNFDYTWSPDGKVLTAQYRGALPANALITWALDATTFKSTAGTPLFDFNNTGSFTTGSGGTTPGPSKDPCVSTNTPADGGSISVAKFLGYVQNSANPPVPDPEMPAVFSASVSSPTNNPVTEVTLRFPGGTTRVLTNNPFVPRFFQFFLQFASQAELDAAVPAGSYAVTVKRQNGTSATATLNLPDGGGVPVPQISNFPQTQSLDPAADFTLRWLPYTGGTAPADSIFLSLTDETGASFFAPDFCVPRDLKVTDTSIVIPRNTFGVGKIVNGDLMFSRNGTQDTNSIPGIAAFSAFSKRTSFESRTAGGTQVTPPQISGISRAANGSFQFTVSAQASSTVIVESSTDLQSWTPLLTTNSLSGVVAFSDIPPVNQPYRFYRATARAIAPGLSR